MNQVLGTTAGNALEVRETIDWLVGTSDEPRLTEVVLALGAEMLVLGGLAADVESATNRLITARADGSAAEHFQAMVTALGGPADLVENPTKHLQTAPVTRRVDPGHNGFVQSVNTRSVGLAVVTLGGGRLRVEDTIDHAVGLSEVVGLGQYVDGERPLAVVHARTEAEAAMAADAVRAACVIGDAAPTVGPVVAGRITE
jgi:thymidine phosphorylase